MKCNFTAIACKQRWQCLRDAYRRALNKKKEKSEQAGKMIKPWKYEHEMAFVAPFFMGRKTKDLIIPSDDELSDNSNDNHVTETTVWEKPSIDIEVDGTPADVDASSTKILDKFTNDESKQKNHTRSKAIKKKTVKSKPSAFAILMAKLVDDQRKLGPSRGHDELDRFFLNISDTVKKFPPYVQALAKNKIFSIVSEMELQQFAPHGRTAYAFKSSPQSADTGAIPTSLDNWNYQTSEIMLTNSDNWNDQTNPSMAKNSESCND